MVNVDTWKFFKSVVALINELPESLLTEEKLGEPLKDLFGGTDENIFDGGVTFGQSDVRDRLLALIEEASTKQETVKS